MRCTVALCLVLLGLVAAVCGEPGPIQQRASFPGPNELKNDPAFAVLVDSTSISGDAILVLGIQATFGDLRQELAPRLEDNGWKIRPRHPQGPPEDSVFAAEKDAMCIYYWNMSPGSWDAGFKEEAVRENPRYEEQASQYVTVFNVWVDDCA